MHFFTITSNKGHFLGLSFFNLVKIRRNKNGKRDTPFRQNFRKNDKKDTPFLPIFVKKKVLLLGPPSKMTNFLILLFLDPVVLRTPPVFCKR